MSENELNDESPYEFPSFCQRKNEFLGKKIFRASKTVAALDSTYIANMEALQGERMLDTKSILPELDPTFIDYLENLQNYPFFRNLSLHKLLAYVLYTLMDSSTVYMNETEMVECNEFQKALRRKIRRWEYCSDNFTESGVSAAPMPEMRHEYSTGNTARKMPDCLRFLQKNHCAAVKRCLSCPSKC